MKPIILITAAVLFSATACNSQIQNAKTETAMVYGNCSMCEATIEKAANKKNLVKADWNKDTKMATITYNSKKTSLEAVLKNIALAGYDNLKFLAPDAAYNKLPACCKYERGLKVNGKGNTPAKDTAIVVTNNANQLQIIFDNYFAVKDALIKTDAAAAAAKARTLLTSLNGVKMETLKTEEHPVWMKIEKNLKKHAQHISESGEIEHQRGHFIDLSDNMITLIKVVKPVTTVYLQHCPMANDGKGADWLSKETVINNPYYGSMMLHCGKTTDTIK